ncbi:hypothetical protein [Streptomyces sp. NPDC006334]|uniref:hypothetical protein n=1 Tax=Streptomyces sp. NPDC006334 TaxID=3156754 RepID=UPI0033B040BA
MRSNDVIWHPAFWTQVCLYQGMVELPLAQRGLQVTSQCTLGSGLGEEAITPAFGAPFPSLSALDAFPWVRFLPEPDLHAFAVDLVETMRAADSVGNSASVAQLLIAWQHTAEVYSDPELLAALTRDHGEGHGPVPEPAGRPVIPGRGDRA